MEDLTECVPNFSEGGDVATLDAIGQAFDAVVGAWTLDRTADVDHGRSVFTLAGEPDPVARAMLAATGVAIDRIDMRVHRGSHPCIGAVDVVPLVPVGRTSIGQCVRDARELGAAMAERYDLPVFLYGAAATRPDRQRLADLRRNGFDGLAERMAEEDGRPDFGPSRPHPTAGAVAVGARPFLIAFNIQVDSRDVAVARRMAGRIRERDGGLPAVQALGMDLASHGCTQLSMNLLDHERTPLWRVWEAAAGMAEDEGVRLIDSELIGLAPTQALTDVADHVGVAASLPVETRLTEAAAWLRIRDFTPTMALELRLAQVRQGR